MPAKPLLSSLFSILMLLPLTAGWAQVNITVTSSTAYQTIRAWRGAVFHLQYDEPLRSELIRALADELGITGYRFEPTSGNFWDHRRMEWLNDDNDPERINWAGFNTSELDFDIDNYIVPLRQRVVANGDPFSIYLSPSFFNGGSSGEVPPWLLNNYGEYGEFALAFITRVRDRGGFTPDLYCVLNEAGNNNPFSATVCQNMINNLMPRLQALGITTRIQFPESINAGTAWNYIQATQGDADMWAAVDVVSYHLYGPTTQLPSIRDFAWARGLVTAQTEDMNLNTNKLYDDMVNGGASIWEIYGMAGPGNECFNTYRNGVAFERGTKFWRFRQLFRYVRPGAVRIDAATDDSNLKPLAFVQNGRMILLLMNGSGVRTANVGGLDAGVYGLCQSVNGAPYVERGLQTIAAGTTFTLNVPSNAFVTLYPHDGVNRPPMITSYKGNVQYLTQPDSALTLTATAQDPELDPLAYAWSVRSQPIGASALIASPHAASTAVSGLTVAGHYAFAVVVSDSLHIVEREFIIPVYAGNQPPFFIDVHNRNPVVVVLPNAQTELRGSALDIEGDTVTLTYAVESQPASAVAQITPIAANRWQASNLDIAGDYVFRLTAHDGTNTTHALLTVPVYPPNNTAPQIASASANPPTITLPVSSTSLMATTLDFDGDWTSHWWSVTSRPAGAPYPTFVNQGKPNATVRNLSVPGTYVFTLTVVDRTLFARRNVTVTVNPGQSKTPNAWTVQ